MDPRKKKQESLKHDRRNTYGENDKSSRKSIRRRKQLVNQIYRHKVKQVLSPKGIDATEDAVAEIRRPYWKKSPDRPLGDVFLTDLTREIERIVSRQSFKPIMFDRLEESMEGKGWEKPAIRVVMRQLKAVANHYWSAKLDLDLRTARRLMNLLRAIGAA
ncbi:MAG TPA: hypothetical protein VHM28_08385 [Anaerolineales bacterium]|jgi:hypothetical protein|nr:hypothetical protein [Anaerolineales bacterium]